MDAGSRRTTGPMFHHCTRNAGAVRVVVEHHVPTVPSAVSFPLRLGGSDFSVGAHPSPLLEQVYLKDQHVSLFVGRFLRAH